VMIGSAESFFNMPVAKGLGYRPSANGTMRRGGKNNSARLQLCGKIRPSWPSHPKRRDHLGR
jgi:hypothetical protein